MFVCVCRHGAWCVKPVRPPHATVSRCGIISHIQIMFCCALGVLCSPIVVVTRCLCVFRACLHCYIISCVVGNPWAGERRSTDGRSTVQHRVTITSCQLLLLCRLCLCVLSLLDDLVCSCIIVGVLLHGVASRFRIGIRCQHVYKACGISATPCPGGMAWMRWVRIHMCLGIACVQL